MSTVETGKFEPYTGTALNLGASGDAVTLPAGVTLKTNTIKDSGGNTIFTSDGSGTLSSVNSSLQGNMVFISSVTASASSSIEFTANLDSTYDEYVFYFVNIHPASNGYALRFQGSTDGNSSFVNMTTTNFYSYHSEVGDSTNLAYYAGGDVANGTPTLITYTIGNDNDKSLSGEFHLFAPSSTTYVKQWYTRTSSCGDSNEELDIHAAGYLNTTSAINAVKFDMSSGNIDAGTIYLYGIK